MRFILLIALGLIAGCSAPKKNVGLLFLDKNGSFVKEVTFKMGADDITLFGDLQTYEIMKIKLASVKNGNDLLGVKNVCFVGYTKSKGGKDYARSKWQAELSVDGVQQELSKNVIEQQTLTSTIGGLKKPIVGELRVNLCTKREDFATVKTVDLKLLTKDSHILAEMTWSAPWTKK